MSRTEQKANARHTSAMVKRLGTAREMSESLEENDIQ